MKEVLVKAEVNGFVAIWRETRVAKRGEGNYTRDGIVGEAAPEAFKEGGRAVSVAEMGSQLSADLRQQVTRRDVAG